MSGVLLDTTVLIDLLRGRADAVARLRRLREGGDRAYVCAINVEEVVRGLRSDERGRALDLLSGLRLVSLGRAEGWQAGEWRNDYASRGRTLSQSDCLIAAAAVSAGGKLATGNPKDFPMRELTVEEWPSG